MAYSTSGTIGIDLATADTSQEFPLGMEVCGSDGNTYTYCSANGAVAAYAACALDEAGDIVELTTTISGAVPTIVVVPQLALADNEFGWAVTKGMAFSVLALTLCAADVKVYTTATAGAIDDTATDLIEGLRLNATVGGSTAATSASAPHGMATNAQS